jgi:hypothetical protein
MLKFIMVVELIFLMFAMSYSEFNNVINLQKKLWLSNDFDGDSISDFIDAGILIENSPPDIHVYSGKNGSMLSTCTFRALHGDYLRIASSDLTDGWPQYRPTFFKFSKTGNLKSVFFECYNLNSVYLYVYDWVTKQVYTDSISLNGPCPYPYRVGLVDMDKDSFPEIVIPSIGVVVKYTEGTMQNSSPIPTLNKISQQIASYPNPFSNSTIIKYSLAEPSFVVITIFDSEGKLVNLLHNSFELQGNHSIIWDGKNINGNKVVSGKYFYKVATQNTTSTKEIVILR